MLARVVGVGMALSASKGFCGVMCREGDVWTWQDDVQREVANADSAMCDVRAYRGRSFLGLCGVGCVWWWLGSGGRSCV